MDRNDLLSATRAEFLQRFFQSVDVVLPHCEEALFNKAKNSGSSLHQGLFLDARSVLTSRHADLRLQLHKSIEHLLNRSMQTTYSTFRPSFSSSPESGLALIDCAVFEDELRIRDMTNRFRNKAEEQLRDLNIRIGLLFEQDQIKERENPFRPYLLSRSITTAIESMGLCANLSAVLLTDLAESMAPHVADIYEAVNALLARHGIAAQLLRKTKRSPPFANLQASAPQSDKPMPQQSAGDLKSRFGTPPVAASRPGQAAPRRKVDQLLDLVRDMAETSSGLAMPSLATSLGHGPDSGAGQNPVHVQGPAITGWLGGKQGAGDVLRKFFFNRDLLPNTQADPTRARSMRATTLPLAGRIDQLIRERIPAGDGDGDGKIRNLVLEHCAILNGMTDDVDEQMTIDIVAMLFEFILRDPQVPAEVRAQLGRLQFLVLKIALHDRTLLTQKEHPARLLVNRIGSISLGLKQLDPSGARITAKVCRIVETLLNDDIKGAGPFLKVLDDFDAFIAHELRAGDEKVERTVQVLENAQGRTLRFVHTTANMNEALSDLSIDPFLRDFLVDAWVHVLERSARTHAKLAINFRLLVPDLLWSILPKAQEQDRAQLFTLLPIILMTLREGLAFSGQVAERLQTLLDWLVDAHTNALRSNNAGLPVPSLASIHAHFKKFIDNPEAEPVSGAIDAHANANANANVNPAPYRRFADESIKELDLRIQLLDHSFERDETLPCGALAAPMDGLELESNGSVMERLRNGVAIAINLNGKFSHGRLNWINPNAADMVLTLDQQGAPSVIGAPTFLRMYHNGRIKFLEAAPLFERAVESLLKSANWLDHQFEPAPAKAAQLEPA